MKGVCAALLVASTVACPTSFELWWKFSWEKHERRASTTLRLPSVQLMAPSWFNTLDTVPTFSCVWHYIRILKRQIPSVKINSFKLQTLLTWQIKESNFFRGLFLVFEGDFRVLLYSCVFSPWSKLVQPWPLYLLLRFGCRDDVLVKLWFLVICFFLFPRWYHIWFHRLRGLLLVVGTFCTALWEKRKTKINAWNS